MEVLVLNTDLQVVSTVDTFESIIWTGRYYGYGDFEIYAKASQSILETLKRDYYLWRRDSDHLMIVEGCRIAFDDESGSHMVFSGRSIESILDRRIIWSQTTLSGNLQNGIKKLLDENAISPTDPDRILPNLIFEASTDTNITSLTVDAQFTYTNLYDSIKKLCAANSIGFRINLSSDNKLVFKLYSGTDRSYEQLINPYVVFSQKFENLVNSNYAESDKTLKTVSLVAGEGEGSSRKLTTVGTGTSLDRREMYTDARDLSQTVDQVLISDADYIAQLAQRGIEDLTENSLEKSFDGNVDSTRSFKYGQDFFLGDIVQIVSDYGIKSRARITEFINSQSSSGIDTYPTFTMID